eukprot:3925869-Lingulodinium_polyedra.AAC.1
MAGGAKLSIRHTIQKNRKPLSILCKTVGGVQSQLICVQTCLFANEKECHEFMISIANEFAQNKVSAEKLKDLRDAKLRELGIENSMKKALVRRPAACDSSEKAKEKLGTAANNIWEPKKKAKKQMTFDALPASMFDAADELL